MPGPPLLLTPWTTPPGLPGLGYPFTRAPLWSTIDHTFISGKRTRIPLWSYPAYRYSIPFEFLRNTATEMQALMAFFNQTSGSAGLFQFNDPDDNTTTGASIGIGDGTTASFQLYRTLGEGAYAWDDPVFAVTGTPTFYLNGVPDAGTFTLSPYGVVTFSIPPQSGVLITWTGTYNWYCRFDADSLEFEKWLSTFYRMKQMQFTTEKYLQ
jgi:uncharacterized protein (TIGR02217 family)